MFGLTQSSLERLYSSSTSVSSEMARSAPSAEPRFAIASMAVVYVKTSGRQSDRLSSSYSFFMSDRISIARCPARGCFDFAHTISAGDSENKTCLDLLLDKKDGNLQFRNSETYRLLTSCMLSNPAVP